jgi:hypothetical protein
VTEAMILIYGEDYTWERELITRVNREDKVTIFIISSYKGSKTAHNTSQMAGAPLPMINGDHPYLIILRGGIEYQNLKTLKFRLQPRFYMIQLMGVLQNHGLKAMLQSLIKFSNHSIKVW